MSSPSEQKNPPSSSLRVLFGICIYGVFNVITTPSCFPLPKYASAFLFIPVNVGPTESEVYVAVGIYEFSVRVLVRVVVVVRTFVAETKPPLTDVNRVVVSVIVTVYFDNMYDVDWEVRVTTLSGIEEVVPHTASPLPFFTAAAVIIRMVEYAQKGVGDALIKISPR